MSAPNVITFSPEPLPSDNKIFQVYQIKYSKISTLYNLYLRQYKYLLLVFDYMIFIVHEIVVIKFYSWPKTKLP